MTSPPAQTVNLTIEGRPVSVPAGTSILEAAKAAGVLIPHYCYHPGLPVAGVCRMCLVDVEKAPKLAPACATSVAEGQVVRVYVKENQRVVIYTKNPPGEQLVYKRWEGPEWNNLPRFEAGTASARIAVAPVKAKLAVDQTHVNCNDPVKVSWDSTDARLFLAPFFTSMFVEALVCDSDVLVFFAVTQGAMACFFVFAASAYRRATQWHTAMWTPGPPRETF